LKESLKIVFSSNISKIPLFILNKETEYREKARKRSKEKKEKGRKASKVSLFEKGEFNILKGENIFKTFLCESIFSPSILPLQKTFSKSFKNS
jgi:hypothetical protein